MASIDKLKASDGSGNASVATVQNIRSSGATTIIVDTVAGINDNFIGTMGTPHTFTDPVTSETITVISEATAVDFSGHVDGSNLEIDDIAPGYTDNGSEVGDIVIIRPTTQWGDEVAAVLEEAHNDDGSLKDDSVTSGTIADNAIDTEDVFADNVDPVKRDNENLFDHIASGLVWTADAVGSTRLASCTSGVVYIAGKRLTVLAVNNRTFTASKDVYCDLVDNGDGTASWVYYDNTTNAASPSFGTTGGTVRGAIIVVGASSIATTASINQGQYDRVLPIASSIAYTTVDSLGNLICPRDPNRKVVGYRRVASFSTASTTPVQVTGISVPLTNIPAGRSLKITVVVGLAYPSTANKQWFSYVYDGTIGGGGTQLFAFNGAYSQTNPGNGFTWVVPYSPTTTSLTLNMGLASDNGGGITTNLTGNGGPGISMLVEIV